MNRAGIFGWLALCSVPAAYAADVVTECDRLASHPEDPNRISTGVERADIDLKTATPVCEKAVADDPSNGRLRYQYARLLFYGNQTAAAMEQMRRSADAGHPQAQFVFGTFITRNRPDAPKDICLAEAYWKKSAAGGRQAARVQYVRYTLKGAFDACPGKAADDELVDILSTAQEQSKNFYEGLVLEDLGEALAKRLMGPSPN